MTYINTTLSLLLSTAILTGATTANAANAASVDNLYMKNGDRLSGTITAYDSDSVTIDTVFGVLDVPVGKIGGVASPRYSADDLLGQAEAAPTPITAATPAEANPTVAEAAPVEVTAPATTSTLDDNADDDAPATGLWGATWSGDANAGLQIEDGNSDSQNYALDASVTGEWDDKDRLKIAAEYENEKEDGETVTDEQFLEILYDDFFSDRWFWQNSLAFERDEIEDLDLRINYLSGLGYRAIDTDETRLQFVLGPGYLREDYGDLGTENSLTAHWATEYEQKFYDDLFRLYHNHDLTAPADDMNAYLFESDTGVEIPMDNGFKVSGEVEFDWDNDPAPGNVEDDTTYNVKVGYEW